MKGAALSFREKLGYGMSDAGCNIIGGAILLFLNCFYTDVFGLASALVGTLLLFTVIPGVGYLITAAVVRLLKVARKLMRTIQDDLALRRANARELSPASLSAIPHPGEIK